MADGILGSIKGLLGGGEAVTQIFTWGVAFGYIQAALGPELLDIQQNANASNPIAPLSPAEAAVAALKNHLDYAAAEQEAAKGGIDAGRFATMYRSAGEPPSLDALLGLSRRGEISDDLLHKAVQESAVRDEWWENGIIQKLGKLPPSPTDFLNALLEGQIDEATARHLYDTFGGILEQSGYDIFRILFDARGSAPTPLEAIEMVHKGAIPWDGTGPNVTSYQQAFLEGPWRNKWADAYRQIGQYLIPPRTIVTMVSHGDLSDSRAMELLLQQGLTREDATAYINEAHNQTTGASKDLAAGEIDTLYYDQAIDKKTALQLYHDLGYSETVGNYRILVQDLKRERKFLESAISRVHSLYVGHKLNKDPAAKALRQLQVPEGQINDLFRTWDLEQAANVAVLTASEIVDAFYYGSLGTNDAIKDLEALGYDNRDARIRLANRIHVPVSKLPTVEAQ